jgi:hypothetical protein
MKTKTLTIKRRGRKPGDGILKTLDRDSTLLEKQVRLTYGRTAGNRLAERVRWFHHLPDMMKDPKKPDFVDKETGENLNRFHEQMVKALLDFKPDWFQAMADAIKAEIAAQDAYPLHMALLEIHGAPKIRRADLIYPENATGENVALKPRYTIAVLCDILKKQGRRPANQGDAEWQRTVRRACVEIGIPYLPGKPGRRRKKS